MYSQVHRTVPTDTKYTSYIRKLNEEHLKKVNTPPSSPPLSPTPSIQNQSPDLIIKRSDEKSTKFADIFSQDESNALQLYLLQKASSAPNIINPYEVEEGIRSADDLQLIKSPSTKRRRSADEPVAHQTVDFSNTNPFGNKLRTSSESVANIVYSSIRPDYHNNNNNHHHHHRDNDETNQITNNPPTGSDSKQDYDPHETLPNVDQLALRHELLNNIRQISRATYFEDLYTGKVSQNDEPPEDEILAILRNDTNASDENHFVNADDKEQRVESWIRESAENTIEEDLGPLNNNVSLYHQSVWQQSEQAIDSDFAANSHVEELPREKPVVVPEMLPKLTNNHHKNALNDVETLEKRPYSFSRSGGRPIDPNSIKHLPIANTNFSTNNSQYSTITQSQLIQQHIPAYSSYPSQQKHNNFSRHSDSPSFNNKSYNNNHNNNEQAQRMSRLSYNQSPMPMVLPKVNPNYPVRKQNNVNNGSIKSYNLSKDNNSVINGKYHKIPRIYQRNNMNQWVAKKVWFYMNGDERFPRIEYRFRPRDLSNMDTLLNLLNKKMPQLPTGARHVFTLDGRMIHSVDELVNEHSYVVSSTRKFKPLNYSRRRRATTRNSNENERESPTLHLPPISGNTDNNIRNVPLIRIKRARSLKTGGGSQHGEKFSYSESNLTKLNNNNSNASKNANYKSLSVTNSNNSISSYNNYYNMNNRKPPTERSDGRVKRSNTTMNVSSKPSRSTSDVPRIVAGVIAEATSGGSNKLERQIVRIINGADPSVQSQVLINTKTSQPWEQLVKDLGLAVRLPRSRTIGNRMETLYGRHVKSYSQLRSELKAGNNAFYIYSDSEEDYTMSLVPNLQHHRLSLIPTTPDNNSHLSSSSGLKRSSSHASVRSIRQRSKASLTKTISNSSSELSNSNQLLSVPSPRRRPPRRRSHTPTPPSPLAQESKQHQSDFNLRIGRQNSRSPSPKTVNVNTIDRMETYRSVHFQ